MSHLLRLLTAVLTLLTVAQVEAATLRSFGARGDGVTDDRAAIEKALQESHGLPIDGEGLTYAVRGAVTARVSVDLKNATFQQVLDGLIDTAPFIQSTRGTTAPTVTPPDALRKMVGSRPLLRHDGVAVYQEDPVLTEAQHAAVLKLLTLRTLDFRGAEGKPISIAVENVKILRGHLPESGMHSNSGGLYIVYGQPVTLRKVEITGNGKGSGLHLDRSRQMRIEDLYLHDLLWAPYHGDAHVSLAALGSDFEWNNSPIYDYQPSQRRFVLVRVQEQLNGFTLSDCEDVEITRCRIDRVGTMFDGQFLPWQADGMTVSRVKNFTMRDSEISNVWEGIDFTGHGVDGFVQQNIRIRDTFAYGFKYAHPQKNGKVIDCVSERADLRSFIIGDECQNIEFIRCVALETGSIGRWRTADGAVERMAGFCLDQGKGELPRQITLENCRAENVQFPQAMGFGFLTGQRASDPAHGIRLIKPEVKGAVVQPVKGFAQP